MDSPAEPEIPPSPRTRVAALLQRARMPRISWRDLAVSLGPVLLISAAVIVLALHFVRPAPPSSLTISTGPEGSSFQGIALKYQKFLAAKGITLKILPSQGSPENLTRLADPNMDVDVGFVQGGITTTADTSDLVSLGSVFYAPLTVFYRSPQPIERLSQLQGKRITIGPEGSGTHDLALALLKANGIEPGGPGTAPARRAVGAGGAAALAQADGKSVTGTVVASGDTALLDLEGDNATKALRARQVDAVFLTGDSAAPGTVRDLLHAEGIRLFDFVQADAYVRRFPYLSKLDMPPGVFDLGDNLPPRAFIMLAPTVELVARSELHPALSDLLIGAAQEVNGKASLLQKAGEFPSSQAHLFPLSDDATRYYKSGKSFFYKFLPLWLASLVSRFAVVVVPALVVLVPGLRMVPAVYGWRVRNRIYKRYGELMALERAALGPLNEEQRKELILRVDEIEKSVISIKIPGAYADQIYILRQHIKFVRDALGGNTPVPVS